MNVTMLSMWYGDAGKHLAERAIHLYQKPGVNRWLFSIRPARDSTGEFLDALADAFCPDGDVVLFTEPDVQPEARIERLSVAGDRLLSMVDESADYVLWHESDLFTPGDLVSRLVETPAAAVGGWPLLSHCVEQPGLGVTTPKRMVLAEPIFYDTWGYRSGGQRFINLPPYHEVYRPEPFRLDTVGSVVLFDAEYVRRGARMNGGGLVGLCDAIRAMGGEVWCDPRVPVVQPMELWTSNND